MTARAEHRQIVEPGAVVAVLVATRPGSDDLLVDVCSSVDAVVAAYGAMLERRADGWDLPRQFTLVVK
jgi:hypothetical protein